MQERVTVYFDYICPYSWRAAELFDLIAQPLALDVRWEHFSLFQNEHGQGATTAGPTASAGATAGAIAGAKADAWQLWNERIDEKDGYGCKGLVPFLASLAARKQGPEAHAAFRLALQRANHAHFRPFSINMVTSVAESVGLDVQRFQHELHNPEARTVLAQEHMRAVARDVFGTPTVVFPSGQTAYLRLQELPADVEEATQLFQDVRRLLERYPYLQTVRRPRAKGN